jgi:hypothetical protein
MDSKVAGFPLPGQGIQEQEVEVGVEETDPELRHVDSEI